MAFARSRFNAKSWRKGSHLISTDSKLISIPQLITIFDSKEIYWARSLPAEAMKEMLESSLVFGLYKCSPASTKEIAVVSGPPQDSREASTLSLPKSVPNTEPPVADNLEFIGLARCITDYTTFLYLTDVWVDPAHQGSGLGRWLISVIQEAIESMPFLRRSILFTGDWERSVPFYKELMGMDVLETKPGEGLALMERKGRGHPSFWQ